MNQERDNNKTAEISLVDILKSLKKHLVLIILITAFFTGLFWSVSKYVIVPTYDSRVKFYIEVATVDKYNPALGLQAAYLAQTISNTYVELMQTNSFYDMVAEEMGEDWSGAALRGTIRYSKVEDTEILIANVRTNDPDLSLEIAQTIAKVAPNAMNKIKSNAILTVVDQPLRAIGPSTPSIRRNTALGFVLGLFLGSMLAILIDMFNIRIRTEQDITKNFDINLLGVVPRIS